MSKAHLAQIAMRLRTLSDMHGNQTEIATALGISAKRWNNIVRSGRISRELLVLLHDHFRVSADWVLFGKGKPR